MLRKRALLLTITVMLCVTVAIVAVACDSAIERIFPDWAYDRMYDGYTNARAEDTDIRVMSANVLVSIESWGGEPVQPRAELFSTALDYYLPDVVGLQEADAEWHRYLPAFINKNYEFVEARNTWGENRTTMIYNKSTTTLLDSGYQYYSKRENNFCRALVWGVFQMKNSDKKYIVTSTHLDNVQNTENRQTQVNELADMLNKLSRDNGNCPVFATGDYNMVETDELYADFINKSKAKNIFKEIDKENIHLEDLYNLEGEEYLSLDHIFALGNYEPLQYVCLASDFYATISDHYPIYVDIELG